MIKNPQPQLWLLLGGNGAGKTTFYDLYLAPRGVLFVNADRIAKELSPNNSEAASYTAARSAESLREQLLDERISFCFETVFSHSSKIDFTAKAKTLGYEIVLIVIHLDNEQLNIARVQQRVNTGGHAVPLAKIVERIPRTLANIKKAIPLADRVELLDNSSRENPFARVASIRQHIVCNAKEPLPDWAVELLGFK